MESKTYFGFAVADGMFPGDVEISRRWLTVDQARAYVAHGVTPCLNPSHVATITAMRKRFGIEVEIPEKPPQVSLLPGDKLVVMSVRGLARLTDRREYTEEEIESASFSFSLYAVYPPVHEMVADGALPTFPTGESEKLIIE